MPVTTMPAVRHEDFCPVVAKEQDPRMESFPYLGDDPATGRTVPTHMVTRCLDCGAASYKQIGA
jgi:hypothetical protein